MECIKIVPRPWFLPSSTDGMYSIIELCLLLADFGNSSPEKWHLSPKSKTPVAILIEFRVQLCVMPENAVGTTWPGGTKQGVRTFRFRSRTVF